MTGAPQPNRHRVALNNEGRVEPVPAEGLYQPGMGEIAQPPVALMLLAGLITSSPKR